MNLGCYVAQKDIQNKELADSLNALHAYIKEEWNVWAIKSRSKTLDFLTKWEIGTWTLWGFVAEDNWNAAYLTFQKYDLNVGTLKKCFRGKPEKHKVALVLYNTAMSGFIEYIKKKLVFLYYVLLNFKYKTVYL